MKSEVYFIDRLTIFNWLGSIWPRLFSGKITKARLTRHCYVVDGSFLAFGMAKASAGVLGISVHKLNFNLLDIKSETGNSALLQIIHHGLFDAQEFMQESPVFQELIDSGRLSGRMSLFLRKSLIAGAPGLRGSIAHSDFMVHVCKTKMAESSLDNSSPILFLERAPWIKAAQSFASARGVSIIPVPRGLGFEKSLRRKLPHFVLRWLRDLKYGKVSMRGPNTLREPRLDSRASEASDSSGKPGSPAGGTQGPRLVVEALGQLNLDRPDLNSDLFFCQGTPLRGEQVVAAFGMTRAPLTNEDLNQLTALGMSAVMLHPGAGPAGAIPLYLGQKHIARTVNSTKSIRTSGLSQGWIKEHISKYDELKSYWMGFCEIHNTRVYVTSDKYNANHMAISDAFQAANGISVVYQRAYESLSAPVTAVGADIIFGFSQAGGDVERRSGSEAQYHVTTGYLGDYRFNILKGESEKIRGELQRKGAKHILAFFDENSRDDPRWHECHEEMQEDYRFLLQKVLDEPWFGLVLKPKIPRTLRTRLGPVSELLRRSIATGRCHVFDDNSFRGVNIPAAAALVADMAVHSHVTAATAGVESVLVGKPTLLIDKEHWPESPLYQLGVGRVVFNEWAELWAMCLQKWSRENELLELGDWSPILNELDPFRDGQASNRMGTYLSWLLEGFENGLDRDTVMSEAAQRYCDAWGADKISEIKAQPDFQDPMHTYTESPPDLEPITNQTHNRRS